MRRSALVTGGSDRIGKEIALTLAETGYDIALHYSTSSKKATETQKLIISKNVECAIFKADFNNPDEVISVYSEISKSFNLEILVNNSSIFSETSLNDNDFTNYDRFFNINFRSAYLLTKMFAINQKKGLIINILDAKSTKNKTKNFDYLLTKKMLTEFTKLSAVNLAPDIRVNGIAPGIILAPEGKDYDYIHNLAQNTPMKKVGSLQNITDSVKFIINNDFITGQIIYVDGGMNL
jgi:pteridine reductase